MKKVLITILILVVSLILFYFIFNLFDSRLHPKSYTSADLPPDSFEKTNGFFLIWGLSEPANVDPLSDDYIRDLRKLFGSSGNLTEAHQRFSNFDQKKYRDQFDKSKACDLIYKIKFPEGFNSDWITQLSSQHKTVAKAEQAAQLMLERYRRAIDAPECRDFVPFNPETPSPNLLAWQAMAKLYTAICTKKAVEGQWEDGVKELIDHITFSRKAAASSRLMLIGLTADYCLLTSLQGLVSIMNHPQCPDSVYRLIVENLPTIQYAEYGNHNIFIAEYLTMSTAVDVTLQLEDSGDFVTDNTILNFLPVSVFMQPNRTKNSFFDVFTELISYDEREPFRWKRNPAAELESKLEWKKPFWWLQNPLGKTLSSIALPNLSKAIYKGYRLKALYDMTRIAAELKMYYATVNTTDKPMDKAAEMTTAQTTDQTTKLRDQEVKSVNEILAGLESYKAVDPYTGKPYVWQREKKRLYSFGPDQKDNNGVANPLKPEENDIFIPVVLKVVSPTATQEEK